MRIRELRKQKGISMKQLGECVGASENSISLYERGVHQPSFETLSKMADYFGVSIDYLLGRESERPKEAQPMPNNIVELNVVVNVASGFKQIEDTDIEERKKIPIDMLHGYAKDECFMIRVRGDSMFPYYFEGDYVVCHQQTSVDSGDVAVMNLNGETMLKRVTYKNGENWLECHSINPKYSPIKITDSELERCFVCGKAISLLRY